MKIRRLALAGACIVEPEPIEDERGFFARLWCAEEFANEGIDAAFVQSSLSHTRRSGTVRGMHFQWPPSEEGKLVRCMSGAIFDVVVDIRPGSETFLEYVGVELSSATRRAIFIPPGFAHGFQTLTDNVDVLYEMTDVYQPDLAAGFRFDDPLISIDWPLDVTVVSERDQSYPDITRSSFDDFS